MKRILAIDPGQSTGWVVIEGRTATKPYFNLVNHGTVKGWTAYEALFKRASNIDVVVIEVFHARPEFLRRLAASKKWVRLEEPEKVGYAKGWCAAKGKLYVEQRPADMAIGHKLLPGTIHKSDSDPNRHWKDALAHAAVYNHSLIHAMPITINVGEQ